MSDDTKQDVSLSIDVKKFRLRIHKNLYHAIGEPRNIQLLVNPEQMVVAIRAVTHTVPTDQSHRIDKNRLNADGRERYEIYSRSFVEKLLGLIPNLDQRYTYLLTGKVAPMQRTAFFPLQTLQKDES